ncbi:MAG: carboxymuconolactone decarboxylase [Herminiimonas sp.]|jgi:alkylhydroperoxidase family enzyme|nr:carboxymuconolactone decarboxylase [Herminiimonas sp.]
MARIPYADAANPEIANLVDRIKSERGGKLINLYGMLLHSPPVAEGWRAFLTAIRQQCNLSGRIRELVILRIAVINGADYEFTQHIPYALKEGISQAQLDGLREGRSEGFGELEHAVLAYTDSMTRDIHVPDAVFEAVRRHFDERELVELTATVAAYNLVSRFLEAFQIDHD